MIASFNQASFDIRGSVTVQMSDGRVFTSSFPMAVWKWLPGKDWLSVTVTDDDFCQSYGWDRLKF